MDRENSVAIIGIAGKFPGSNTIDEFWNNLINKKELISTFDKNELIHQGVDAHIVNNANYVPRSGVIEDIELFDASFFGFNPKEAELLDPQHRLLLESAYECMENAGYVVSNDIRVGVYIGVGSSDYLVHNISSNSSLMSLNQHQIMLGNEKDFSALYLSYKLNLKGPSVVISTACSTSLVAIHTACRSLLSYECDMALAGASKIAVPHKVGYLAMEGGIDSPDGHCKAFDINAKGTVISNGVGIVALKD